VWKSKAPCTLPLVELMDVVTSIICLPNPTSAGPPDRGIAGPHSLFDVMVKRRNEQPFHQQE